MPDDELDADDPQPVEAEDAPDTEVDADGDGEAVSGEVDPLTRDDLGTSPTETSTRVRLAVILVLVFLAGGLVGRITAPDDESSRGDDTAADGAVDDGSGGVDFPKGDVNRTGYWGFVSLTPIVIDTFDRDDNPETLGDAGEGGTWDPVSGTWGIRDDAAITGGGQGDGPFLAVVPGGRGDGLTELTMTVVEEGAGMVFRYLNPQNYWSITANPGVGTWSVTRVIDGESELVGELAGPTADDTTISVEQKGSNLRFLLDGVEYLAVTDGALADQLQGGLIAAGTTRGEARWNRFLVLTYGDVAGGPASTTTAPA